MGNESARQLNPFSQAAAGGLVAVEQQRAVAEVQAAIIVARANPRDRVAAVDAILSDCTDPALAEEAEYEFSRGGTKITGPSIRLMETIARRWGNFECGVRELARREGYSEMEAYAWDMETNVRDRKIFQVRHWRDTREGGYAIEGERDVYEATANSAARRKRACMQAVIPSEMVEQALAQCEKTLSSKVPVTPERTAEMVKKFAEFGVTREMLEARIQRHLDAITSGQMAQLGRIHNSIRDGMSGAADWFSVAAKEEAPKTGADRLREGARAATRGKKAKPESDAGARTGESPTTVLKDVLALASRAAKGVDVATARIELDDARDLARSLSGAEAEQAKAAIDEAQAALDGRAGQA